MITDRLWAETIVWLYGSFSFLWLLQWWLGQHIQGLALLVFRRPGAASNLYFYLLAPGVVIHELSHWLFARLLLVRTGDVALFRPNSGGRGAEHNNNGKITLGYVEIYPSDPIRHSLIGLAPLPTGILVLLLLSKLLGFDQLLTISTASNHNWDTLSLLPGRIIASLGQLLNFLWLYLVFTVGNGMLPSKADRKPWLVGFILPGLVILGLVFNGNLKLPDQWQQNILNLLGTLTWIFAFVAVIDLFLALLIAVLEYLFSRFSRRRIIYPR